MASKAAVKRAVDLLRDVQGEDVQVHTSLDDAIAKAAGDSECKHWAVLSCGSDTLRKVHTALANADPRVGVAIVATEGPVSQVEVLRAMEYGGVYAAAQEFRSDADADSSAGLALSEASTYRAGPSFVLLATPAAVDGDEKWTSFTYDPRREDGAFVSEASKVRKEIEEFLARENLLTLIAKKSVASADASAAGGDALTQGMGEASKTVTILYTSDTGHGEECAKAVARQCRNGGFASSAVRCGTLDSFDVGALPSEPLIIFCVSTAGKGDFPGNGRNFFINLHARKAELEGKLEGLKYAMFGLGDSHYWGKGTEDSKINFAKPARDLDEILESYGAQRLMPIGFGDDQDVDQYHTGFGEWQRVDDREPGVTQQ